MNVAKIQKRVVIKRVLVLLVCAYAGWFLKARLTPPAMNMGMGGGADPYVVTQKVTEEDVSPSQTYIGSVEPINAVDLRPQVTGYVEKVLFQEGSIVNQGDILFVIEQDRYIANVNLRQAELKKAQALLIRVEKDHKRQQSLNKQKYASEAALDNAYSDLLQAQAAIKQADANLELAKIDLNHTEIKAPFAGYIGKALVTEGNYVNASNEVLARIVQMNPIRVSFSMSDKDFLNFRELFQSSKEPNIRARLVLPNGKIIENELLRRFTDNEVNNQTATIASYLEFDNANNMLVPGNYVNLLVGKKTPVKAFLIPTAAIAQDENGNFVMVVNKDSVAEQRRVNLGETIGSKVVAKAGLKNGDELIIQGLQKAREGQKVRTGMVKEDK